MDEFSSGSSSGLSLALRLGNGSAGAWQELPGRGGSTGQHFFAELAAPLSESGSAEEPLTTPAETTALLQRALQQIRPTVEATTWTAFWNTTVLGQSAPEVAQQLHYQAMALCLARGSGSDCYVHYLGFTHSLCRPYLGSDASPCGYQGRMARSHIGYRPPVRPDSRRHTVCCALYARLASCYRDWSRVSSGSRLAIWWKAERNRRNKHEL